MKERLALARHYQELIDTGFAESRADLARQFKVSRAAITILMNLLQLAPEIQAHIDSSTGAPGEFRLTKRDCRRILLHGDHLKQIPTFRDLVASRKQLESAHSRAM